MKDDAVAPVIAIMLILATIVTFYSLWNAHVIPSLKQSSEVDHLHNVESAFQHLSSDIERAVAFKQDNLVFSEPVQMGGGDTAFDSLRSAGSLYVRNESQPVYTLTLYDRSGNAMATMDGTLVAVSYEPVGNYWQDQGYSWQYGYINVTKYRTLETPLGYYTMTNVRNGFEGDGSLGAFARSFGTAEYTMNQSAMPGNCSAITLIATNLTALQDRNFASGNGYGTVKAKSTVKTISWPDVYHIRVESDQTPFGNATLENWNTSLSVLADTCTGNNITYLPEPPGSNVREYSIEQGKNPLQVVLKTVSIEVGVS